MNSRRILSLAFSPGLAWIATTCSDGTLSIYQLVGAEHEAALDPALHMRLKTQPTSRGLQNAAVWFEPDGSAVNVGYTELMPEALADTAVQLMRLPLVPDDRIAQQAS